MYRSTILLAFICTVASSVFGQTINPTSSEVAFEVSNFWINTVSGTFSGIKGTVHFDPADLKNSTFNVCVAANSIESGIDKRDKDLMTEEYLDAGQYPTICFVSSSIEAKGDSFLVKGSLTLKGVTKQIEIPFSYANQILTGELTIERVDYKVGVDTGSFMIGKEIEIRIKCVLSK